MPLADVASVIWGGGINMLIRKAFWDGTQSTMLIVTCLALSPSDGKHCMMGGGGERPKNLQVLIRSCSSALPWNLNSPDTAF